MKYELTKEQLRSLTDPKVKEWFSEVFKTVLEVGKWYIRGDKSMFNFSGNFDCTGDPCGYGFISGTFLNEN